MKKILLQMVFIAAALSIMLLVSLLAMDTLLQDYAQRAPDALNSTHIVYFYNVCRVFLIIFGFLIIVIMAFFVVKLNIQKNRSEERNREKSNFLAIMSHEIRTPMNAIIGISEMQLMESDEMSEKSRDALTRIYSSGHSLLAIINDILDMSKIETGSLELLPVEYDMATLISDTAQINLIRKGEKPVEFFLNVSKDIPARLIGDEVRIRQILNNIMSNAFKYTDKGFVRLEVSTKQEGGETIIVYKIADSGKGLKREHIKKIFSENDHIDGEANRNHDGTGLGMAITKRLLELMGGKIEIVSEPGVGSVFTVSITQTAVGNVKIGSNTADMLNTFRFVATPTNVSITREYMPYARVMVVDDVEVNLFVARGLLMPYGMEIDTAVSGEECIRFVQERIKEGNEYSLILMDHMMPEMDGIETTKILHEKFGLKNPIIVLTANAVAGAKKMFKENGFDDFMPKPIDIRHLNLILNKYIRDRQSYETLQAAKNQKPVFDEFRRVENGSEQIMRIFKRDAQRALFILESSVENLDYKAFTITVHAMKSALANIGRKDLSRQARLLETAGNGKDIYFIKQNVAEFVSALKEILADEPEREDEDLDSSEDREFLAKQLKIIYDCCEKYDAKKAEDTIKILLQRPWQLATVKMIEDLSETILFSDFEPAQSKIKEMLGE